MNNYDSYMDIGVSKTGWTQHFSIYNVANVPTRREAQGTCLLVFSCKSSMLETFYQLKRYHRNILEPILEDFAGSIVDLCLMSMPSVLHHAY